MRAVAAIAALGTAFLVACVKPPPVEHPSVDLDVPESWTAVGELSPSGEVPDAWWEDFGAPALSEAVQAALDRNHDLRAAAARVERAAAQARIAGADLEPALDLGINASRRKQNFIGFPIPGEEGSVLSTTFTNYGASLNLSWEIDLWGRLRAGARAALADLQAARADYAAARLSLAGQTAKAWLAAAEAAQQVDLARRTVETWRRSFQQVQYRYEQGVRSPLDVRLARTSLADAEALLEVRRNQQDAAVRQIEILMGRYPGRELADPESLPGVPSRIPAGLPAEMVSRRPDLAASERRLAAADQRLRSARRSLYPRFTLTASGGTASAGLSDLVDGNFSVWSLAAGLFQPLFQGGRLRAGVDDAEAGTREALEIYISDVLRAYGEVEAALAAEQYLARETEYLSESSVQSAAARELAQGRYEFGLEDYVTVLEAQRRELNSQAALLEVRRLRLNNRVDLYLALGGGFRTGGAPGGSAAAAVTSDGRELDR